MNEVVTGAEFAASLLLERDAAKAFAEILQREQEALTQGEIERLETLAADKMRIVRLLVDFAERRNRRLVSLGLGPDSKGMQTWLAHGADAKAAAAWRDLLRLAQTVQQLNQTNGAIIATRLRHNQQAFAALLDAGGGTSLYGPKGQTLGLSGARALGQV